MAEQILSNVKLNIFFFSFFSLGFFFIPSFFALKKLNINLQNRRWLPKYTDL